ncbi:hypothetical protein JTB14_005493 [Gonioctena quinquepunctata]|nr:hypothetical protein JTB14_005493 [Gonioctena quinquepunctata]
MHIRTMHPLRKIYHSSHNPENVHGIEAISQKSRHFRHSTTSSITNRRRELALNMEKAKQEIEMKKLELDNQFKLLQIEHEFHQQEINETTECESIKSTRSLYPTVRVLTPISQPPSSPKTTDIQNWVNEIEIQQDQEQPIKEDSPTVPREMTGIQLLCKTLSKTFLKATSRPEDNFRMYRFMEDDFPISDGNPADWPMFISQVHLISSMCKFSNEEEMVAFAIKGKKKCNIVVGNMEIVVTKDFQSSFYSDKKAKV